MITVDGASGEGGGQILRTSLALSLVTGQAFRIEGIRLGRAKPGLLRQHLTAVEAAQRVGQAEVKGGVLGSTQLEFCPGRVTAGEYHFSVGTAGSATLVLQTILPPLMLASAPSEVWLEGGTHNAFAPPYDFLARSFLPLIQRMGPRVEVQLERAGFYPAGGGRFQARIEPVAQLIPMHLLERGEVRERRVRALVARLPLAVGERELARVRLEPGWGAMEGTVEAVRSPGPGNAVLIEVEATEGTAVFTGFGERGRAAEVVAQQAVTAAEAWLAADVPVDEHLADQLLIPLALAGAGSFRTSKPTAHTSTNAKIIEQFLPVQIGLCPGPARRGDGKEWTVEIRRR
jgi:RNA 3'-terminal phosphate cyclase (ATP)